MRPSARWRRGRPRPAAQAASGGGRVTAVRQTMPRWRWCDATWRADFRSGPPHAEADRQRRAPLSASSWRVSNLRFENARELAASPGPRPPNGNRADAEQRADVVDRQLFELVQHDDRAAARRKHIERGPYSVMRDEGRFRVLARR